MLRHRQIFENEEKQTTEVIMRGSKSVGIGIRDESSLISPSSSEDDRDDNRLMTLKNLEQYRMSHVMGTRATLAR